MPVSELWPLVAVVLLGAYHGVNPAMGWLFAVALGLQQRQRSAVLLALAPIALGHALSVALFVVLFGSAQLLVDPSALQLVSAAALILFGLFKLVRPGAHPRWVGMRVTLPELAFWSFLMATAHGAGLMLVPLLGLPVDAHEAGHYAPALGTAITVITSRIAMVVAHSLAMFTTMAAVALIVYEQLGLALLSRAWLNLDRLWAIALVATGSLTLIV